jgi:hypothetical protein
MICDPVGEGTGVSPFANVTFFLLVTDKVPPPTALTCCPPPPTLKFPLFNPGSLAVVEGCDCFLIQDFNGRAGGRLDNGAFLPSELTAACPTDGSSVSAERVVAARVNAEDC